MEMKNKNFNRSFGFFLHSFGLENQDLLKMGTKEKRKCPVVLSLAGFGASGTCSSSAPSGSQK